MRRIPWTREQLDFLADHYGLIGWPAKRIQAEMSGPARTVRAIRQKADYLGLAKIGQRGNWKHDPKVAEDIYDMAVMDYSLRDMTAELTRQHGITVSPGWVCAAMKKHLPAPVHKSWAQRTNQRRSRRMTEFCESRAAA